MLSLGYNPITSAGAMIGLLLEKAKSLATLDLSKQAILILGGICFSKGQIASFIRGSELPISLYGKNL